MQQWRRRHRPPLEVPLPGQGAGELAWLVQLALPVQAGLLVEEIRLARGK